MFNTSRKVIFGVILVLVGCSSVTHYPDKHVPPTQKASQHVDHILCLYACPSGADPNNFLVDNEIYLLSSNRDTKFADWVAYQVVPKNLGGGTHRRNWKKDPSIPADYTLSPNDYKGAYGAYGYDRGHQAPLGDFSNNPNWAKTNYLSNITPQKADLNRGAWVRLESKERALASKEKYIYVLTGPVYLKESPNLPNATLSHKVPSGYWKIIAAEDEENDLHVASFYLQQDLPRNADFCDYNVQVGDIERLTRLQFFERMPKVEVHSLLEELGC